jgi:hypothetical protein
MSTTLTVAQAAELMGLSRRHARKRLVWLDEAHPARGLLHRPSGSPVGHLEVNPQALRQILLGQFHDETEDLSVRVGLAESDISTLQNRMRRVEIATEKQKRCSDSVRP